ncbi:hypothetical protein ABZW32_00005, partial [Streptomyces sp. NPDC004667]
MTALLRYQAALLLRSQRWIAPLVVYAGFVAVGIRPGDRALDSLGYAAAGLVPQTAWLVRICVSAEPPAHVNLAMADGVRQICTHLLDHGHRDILHLASA